MPINPTLAKMMLVNVSLERRKLLVEVRLELIKPGLHGNHRRRPQPEIPHPGVASRALVGDDPSFQEHPQVAAHSGRGHAYRGCELASSVGRPAQQFHDLTAGWVRERREDVGDGRSARLIVAHKYNS